MSSIIIIVIKILNIIFKNVVKHSVMMLFLLQYSICSHNFFFFLKEVFYYVCVVSMSYYVLM